MNFYNLPPKHVGIYALVDPRNPEVVRYIGRSRSLRIRHLQHISMMEPTKKGEWLESLWQEAGVLPQMKVLEIVPEEMGREREHHWINQFPGQLVNTKMGYNPVAKKPAKTVPNPDTTPGMAELLEHVNVKLPPVLSISPQQFTAWTKAYERSQERLKSPELARIVGPSIDSSELVGWLHVMFTHDNGIIGAVKECSSSQWLQLLIQISGHHYSLTPSKLTGHFKALMAQFPKAIQSRLDGKSKVYFYTVDYPKLNLAIDEKQQPSAS